mgnify:CR=1 FL=1
MQYGTSTKTQGTDFTVKWHGGTGLFSAVVDPSGSFSGTITLEHDVSASGETANYVALGPEATFTSNGQTIFTTAANTLRVNFSADINSDYYHIVVKPVNERSAY